MNVKQAKSEYQKWHLRCLDRVRDNIESRARNGKKYLLCRSNKQTRQQLKSDGFGVIFIASLTLVRW